VVKRVDVVVELLVCLDARVVNLGLLLEELFFGSAVSGGNDSLLLFGETQQGALFVGGQARVRCNSLFNLLLEHGKQRVVCVCHSAFADACQRRLKHRIMDGTGL